MGAAKTRVMGILNVTPDSFSDGGLFLDVGHAVERAREMAGEGADMIDVGGESTRPMADDVTADEEIRRVVPVIERIAQLGPPVCIDTRKSLVAKAAIDAGAAIVNDVSAGTYDPSLLPLVADRKVSVVLMHMRGDPKTMDSLAQYGEVVSDVHAELARRVRVALDAGVHWSRIFVDPGLGFAKTPEQSLRLLRYIEDLRGLGPLVVGPSRKRFVGHATGADVGDRLGGTMGAVAWCAIQSVDVVRVHDVRQARQVVDIVAAIESA